MASAQAGIDIGDVTVNNTTASPVPISDAGGALTVDGVYPDANVIWTLSCPAQKQVSLEVGPRAFASFLATQC